MNYPFIISCAITGTLSFLFGIFVYLRNRSSSVNKIWMMLNFCVSLWSWSLFARELAYRKNNCSFFCKIMLCWSHLPTPALSSFRKFLSEIAKEKVSYSLLCGKLYLHILRFHPFTHQRRKANTILSLLRYPRTALSFLCSILYRYCRL